MGMRNTQDRDAAVRARHPGRPCCCPRLTILLVSHILAANPGAATAVCIGFGLTAPAPRGCHNIPRHSCVEGNPEDNPEGNPEGNPAALSVAGLHRSGLCSVAGWSQSRQVTYTSSVRKRCVTRVSASAVVAPERSASMPGHAIMAPLSTQ